MHNPVLKRVLCIWLPSWPIQRLIVVQPELKHQAILLHHRDARRGELVVHCSPAAWRCGARPFRPLAEAQSLLRQAHSPSPSPPQASSAIRSTFHVLPYQPHRDREALRQLGLWCERFSPRVGLEEAHWRRNPAFAALSGEPECLFLDTTHLAPLYGDETAMAQTILRQFAERGLYVRVGLADTLGAAWALAHTPHETLDHLVTTASPHEPLLSISEPQLRISPEGQTRSLVPCLPLQSLRLPHHILEPLSQLGIQRVAQLMQLPRDGLVARLGPEVLQRLDQALGTQDEFLQCLRDTTDFQAARELEYATTDRSFIEALLAELLRKITRQLQQADQGAVQLECILECESPVLQSQAPEPHARCSQLRLHVALFQPTANPQHLHDLIQLQFETLPLPAPLKRVTLRVQQAATLAHRQAELFGTSRHSDTDLALLIERLSGRLGSERVTRPVWQAIVQPELAVHYQPLTLLTTRRTASLPADAHLMHRPLRLYSPRPLDMHPPASAGPPQQFRDGPDWHHILHCWGPERIETSWWRSRHVEPIRRDYFRVETSTGERYWIFHCLRTEHWFLHGEFT